MPRGGYRIGAGHPRTYVTLRLDVAYAARLALLADLIGLSHSANDVESAVVRFLIDQTYEQVSEHAEAQTEAGHVPDVPDW